MPALFLLFFAVFHTAQAARVDLSDRLVPAKTQVGGLCQLWAATGMAEDVCYRRTGKTVSISEAFTYTQHLRLAMVGNVPSHREVTMWETEGDTRVQVITRVLQNTNTESTLRRAYDFSFTGLDGSAARITLSLFKARQVLSEKEFELSRELQNFLLDKINSDQGEEELKELKRAKGSDHKNAVRSTHRARAAQQLDAWMQGKLPRLSLGNDHYVIDTDSSDLANCMAKGDFAIRFEVINNKRPVRDVLPELSEGRRAVLCDMPTKQHSVLFVGYETNDKDRANRYLVRDSATGTTQWTSETLPCAVLSTAD